MSKVRAALLCLLLTSVALAACGRDGGSPGPGPSPQAGATTTAPAGGGCEGVAPEATDVGITAESITIEVMADVGSPLAPGLFQGNVDAVEAFAEHVNESGGIACRDLVVKVWDSRLDPTEAKNGQIDACENAFAMVGSNALFNPDVSTMEGCGLPNLPGTANDPEELCASTTWMAGPVVERCPVVAGKPRPFVGNAGSARWYETQFPGEDLHGTYMIPGDLPTTIQSAMWIIRSQEEGGAVYDHKVKVSGRTEQAGFTPIIQSMRQTGSNFVTNGTTDTALIRFRREARAQGYEDEIKLWTCIPSCYSRPFVEAAADVDGTHVTLGYLPFEEADENEELAAFLDAVGEDKVNGFGALAWQAGVLFRQAVDAVVEAKGVNGLTRESLLEALAEVRDFDANGWAGGRPTLKDATPCFMIVQLQDGEWVRRHPEERGTLDCEESNSVTFELDPAAEAAELP